MSSRSIVRLLALAAFLAVLAGPAPGQDKGNPIVDAVKAQIKDPAKPFTMMVSLQVKEGAGDKFEAAFAKAVKPTRKEKGCVAYDLNRDPKKPGHYLVYERWQSLAALDAHVKTDHITTLLKEVGDLLTVPPEIHVLMPAGE